MTPQNLVVALVSKMTSSTFLNYTHSPIACVLVVSDYRDTQPAPPAARLSSKTFQSSHDRLKMSISLQPKVLPYQNTWEARDLDTIG